MNQQLSFSPIEILIKACVIAYQRGAFHIKEAETISKAFTALNVDGSLMNANKK